MKVSPIKLIFFVVFSCLATTFYSYSQQGNVTINQDEKITELLNLKKEMNKSDVDLQRYKIQIYNGNRAGANAAKASFRKSFWDWSLTVVYEQPNFKTWAGNFRTRLEADRALKRIKAKFPSAFIFKPKRKKG